MNRFEHIRRVLVWESVAAAARAKAAGIRDLLTADARAEYEEQGTAPTWRLPDIGTVSLPVSKETVYVADEPALIQWAKLDYPGEVETIERIRPAFLSALLARVAPSGGGVADPETGRILPGLSVRPGGQPGSLSFRPSTLAKQVAAAGAERLMEDVERAIEAPATEVPDAAS